MTLRHAVLGLMVVFGVSVWSWCHPTDSTAKAHDADPIYTADDTADCTGGDHDEAVRRYRNNQSTHWRQVAIRRN
jgi:hypothetical protein